MSKATESLEDVADVYVARMPGWPGYVAAVVNDPKWAKETAKDIAEFVRNGYEIVGLVTRAESIRGMNEFVEEKKRRKALPARADLPEGSLFG